MIHDPEKDMMVINLHMSDIYYKCLVLFLSGLFH